MLRQASQRRVVVPTQPAAMINRPTVEAGGSLPNKKAVTNRQAIRYGL